MEDIKKVIEEKKAQIEQLRDEIKLQAHLGKEEAKGELEKLEKEYESFLAKLKPFYFFSIIAMISSSLMIRCSSPSILISVPAYFPKRILSPFFTSRGTCSPLSRLKRRISPTCAPLFWSKNPPTAKSLPSGESAPAQSRPSSPSPICPRNVLIRSPVATSILILAQFSKYGHG